MDTSATLINDLGLSAGESVQWSERPRQGIGFRRADILLTRRQAIIFGVELHRELGNRGKFHLGERKLLQRHSSRVGRIWPNSEPYTGRKCEYVN